MNLPSSRNNLARHRQEAEKDSRTWHRLKQVIADSSGFEKWQRSRQGENRESIVHSDSSLDELVQRYLRETLETLAY
jgi:hypothetical protein